MNIFPFSYHQLKGIIMLIYTITRVYSQPDHCIFLSLTITILDVFKNFQNLCEPDKFEVKRLLFHS